MVVHLIKTPEYDLDDFQEVFNLLSLQKGDIKFELHDVDFSSSDFYFLRYSLYPYHNFEYDSDTQLVEFIEGYGFPLSWRELFSLCDYYREEWGVKESDFVVLLTMRKNALNWFTGYDSENRNVFVHCADWEKYTKAHHKFPVAYEIIAGILRSLMKAPLGVPNPYTHIEPLGCMNDFCGYKREIILKLRTADVCDACLTKMVDEGVALKTIQHALAIFEDIRTQLMMKQGFKTMTKPGKVTVDKRYNIKIDILGGIEIKQLTPLYKSLYVLYLKHPEGIALKELFEYRNEVVSIYEDITGKYGDDEAVKSINNMITSKHPDSKFSQIKSRINAILATQLGEPLASFYQIDGNRGESFKIDIPKDMIDIRF
jgi:hypothetical protein